MRIIEKADKIVKLTQDQVIQALEIPLGIGVYGLLQT